MGVFFPIGSGGGGSYIDGTVPTPADLPITIGYPAIDAVYLAKAPSGIYFLTRKPAGLYCRTANDGALSDWTFLGSFPEVNSDANWRLYNDTTTSKQLAFDLSGISASTTRTLTVPNASGTLVLSNDGRIATIGSGTINTSCSPASEDPGTAGSISTYSDYGATAGGYISTIAGSVGNGGYINTSGGGDFDGGYINTSEGGYINTSGQGGSINTTGTGFIQLGTAASNTRTTLNGSASGSNKTITLPNATGTVALLSGSIFTTLNATNGTITASAPVLDLAQTWNASGVAFTTLKLNVTATLAASNSLLADLQIGGAPVFSVARISSTAGNVGAWLYGTYSGAGANYERGFMRWSAAAGTFQFGTEKLGTGSARALEFQTDGTTRLTIDTGGGATFSSSIFATNGFARIASAQSFQWLSRSKLYSLADGNIGLYNAGESGFNLLQFGGTTSSFPALKRSSTVLQAVLANDGGFTAIQGKLTTDTAYTATTVTPTGYVTIYDSTGTAYKVPCVL